MNNTSKNIWQLTTDNTRPYKSEIIFENFVKSLDIPDVGYCVQIGIGTGHTLNLMKNFFGSTRTKGIDLYNFLNDPCVITQDIMTIDFDLPIAYAENDVGDINIDSAPRLYAYKWALKNLITGGKLITTSNVANKTFGVDVEQLARDHNCVTVRLDKFNNCSWAQTINTETKWNTVSMMLVTKI